MRVPTSLNYAARIQELMPKLKTAFSALGGEGTRGSLQFIVEQEQLLNHAVHFHLPDSGKVLDAGWKSLRGEVLRLPYPAITLEYEVTDTAYIGETQTAAPKRLVTAFEMPGEKLATWLPTVDGRSKHPVDEDYIVVYSYYYTLGTWAPSPIAWILPTKWDEVPDDAQTLYQVGIDPTKIPTTRRDQSIYGTPLPITSLCSYILSNAVSQHPDKDHTEIYNSLCSDMAMEVCPLLELLEALSCTNVTHTPIARGKPINNAKRIRQGKLPLNEVRILVIDAGKEVQHGSSEGGVSSGSVRQHLCRGHIRKHPTAGKVWVNSHLRGDPTKGSIHKSYSIT